MTAEKSPVTNVHEWVRTPFSVRRNIVKVWRRLPPDLWIGLSLPDDKERAVRVERRSLTGAAAMAVLLLACFAGVGYQPSEGVVDRSSPVLGKSTETSASTPPPAGWYYQPLQSASLALWVICPTFAGWAFVRLLWIPLVAAAAPTRDATLNLARQLGAVYFYVFVMIVVGAALMIPLMLVDAKGTETFRWCFWCFLFGESFFVPGAMWLRLVILDRSGHVFGARRYQILAVYLLLTVVIPIIGMVKELD